MVQYLLKIVKPKFSMVFITHTIEIGEDVVDCIYVFERGVPMAAHSRIIKKI